QALLRALCGQLITSSRAREIERAVVRAASPEVGPSRLRLPPGCRELGRFAPAELRRLGLHARRGAVLARICRSLDLDRPRDLAPGAVAARPRRERGLGPWSVGVICLQGLGRREVGLEGDLGLIKLLAALRGRPVEAWETEELLAPYGEWAGLASVYLLTGLGRGLVPGDQRRSQTTASQIDASKSAISGTISNAVVTGSTPGSATASAATAT